MQTKEQKAESRKRFRVKHPNYGRDWIRQRRATHPEYALYTRWHGLRSTSKRNGWAIPTETLEEFLVWFRNQMEICQSQCQSCGTAFAKSRREPHVDHCHKTGKLRGLVCRTCNRNEAVGTHKLQAAISYVQRHAEVQSERFMIGVY